jgi:hypothetical protein
MSLNCKDRKHRSNQQNREIMHEIKKKYVLERKNQVEATIECEIVGLFLDYI